jgi:hypothetical protein
MPDIHDVMDVTMDELSPEQQVQLKDTIEQFHNKTGPVPTFESFSRVIEFFERSHRSIDLRKYRQPCIMSSIMRWI